MTPAYALELGLVARKADVGAQKIDGSSLETYRMVIAGLLRFFEKTFLLANRFAEKELVWRSYTAAEALPTTKMVELINKKEFAAAALNKDDETFMAHVTSIIGSKMTTPKPESPRSTLKRPLSPYHVNTPITSTFSHRSPQRNSRSKPASTSCHRPVGE